MEIEMYPSELARLYDDITSAAPEEEGLLFERVSTLYSTLPRTTLDSIGYDLLGALTMIQEPWFVYSMGETVTGIVYRGDQHEHRGYYCDLQHRDGGRLSRGTGSTLSLAVLAALVAVKRHYP